jgi:hypothetical protein
MKHSSTRMRLLLAFEEQGTPLTKREIMERAATTDQNELRHVQDAGLIEALDWVPNQPRRFYLTESGIERRNLLVKLHV